MTQSPAGWYPDPYGTPLLRWWDGSQWTDATHRLETPAAQGVQAGAQPDTGARGDASPGTRDAATGTAAGPATGSAAAPGAEGGGPAAATPQWAALDGTARRGDTARLPVPDLPPPRPSGSAEPPRPGGGMARWVAAGVAVAVVVVLAIIGTVYVTSGGGREAAGDGLAVSSPTASAEPSPETEPPVLEPSPRSGSLFPQPAGGRIDDPISGLSYHFPGAPWQVPDADMVSSGDPLGQRWTSGYQAISQRNFEPGRDWAGTVLAGPLAAGAPYDGPASARNILATFLVNTESVFYEPPHERRILEDKAITVDGRPGWLLKFEMDFTEQSRIHGWKWRTEVGALVLVDRGRADPPALLFATVPDNLDVRVVDEVVRSLKVS